MTYILDEPTAGLHPQERTAVLTVIRRLLAAGNNVFVVEHDMDFVAQADYLIDIGPYAGDGEGPWYLRASQVSLPTLMGS